MRMCDQHWQALKEAITARGLSAFMSSDGKEAMRRLVASNAGESKTSFDPLVEAHNGIVFNTLDAVGLVVMGKKEDGSEHCPICFVINDCVCGQGEGCLFRQWIDCAADDMLEKAKRLGLVGSA